jgi:protein-S-isoprenylcysteine O-methyltransferase Ste14
VADLIEDLRIFIGAFFLILSVILISMGVFSPSQVEGFNLNLICGLTFLVFSVLALWLAYLGFRSRQLLKTKSR